MLPVAIKASVIVIVMQFTFHCLCEYHLTGSALHAQAFQGYAKHVLSLQSMIHVKGEIRKSVHVPCITDISKP